MNEVMEIFSQHGESSQSTNEKKKEEFTYMMWFKIGLLLNLSYSELEDMLKTSTSTEKKPICEYRDEVLRLGLKDKTWSFLYEAIKHVYRDTAKEIKKGTHTV